MNKLYYCLDCKRVFKSSSECCYCKSFSIKELSKNAPINVIGSKIKGRVLKINQDDVSIRFISENKEHLIREFDPDKIRKVL